MGAVMEHVVIHDPDAGEVHVWRDGKAVYSASKICVFSEFNPGFGINEPAVKGFGDDPSWCQCMHCVAYRKHLELRDD